MTPCLPCTKILLVVFFSVDHNSEMSTDECKGQLIPPLVVLRSIISCWAIQYFHFQTRYISYPSILEFVYFCPTIFHRQRVLKILFSNVEINPISCVKKSIEVISDC